MKYHTCNGLIRTVSPLTRRQPFISVRENNLRAYVQQLAAACDTDTRV